MHAWMVGAGPLAADARGIGTWTAVPDALLRQNTGNLAASTEPTTNSPYASPMPVWEWDKYGEHRDRDCPVV